MKDLISISMYDYWEGCRGRPGSVFSESLDTVSFAGAAPILMLVASNVFMTFAWYGHLRFADRPLGLVIAASWGIAFFEYCLAVPANRIGHTVYSTVELKTLQEIITLIVFAGFSVLYLGERLAWNHVVGFAFLMMAAFFIFKRW